MLPHSRRYTSTEVRLTCRTFREHFHVPIQDLAEQRARRLRRKRLAQKVVAHWKHFAREGIAAARARAYASTAPRRRALTRWRAAVTAARDDALRRTAAAGRRRYLAESRAVASWAAKTRAAREHRLRHNPEVGGLDHSTAARARRALGRWRSTAEVRRSARAAERAARAHNARRRATLMLHRWRGATEVAMARREVEAAVLRAWAAGRLRCGFTALGRQVVRGRRNEEWRARAVAARRRRLASRGLSALGVAIARATAWRDRVAKADGVRARLALRRWQRRTGEAQTRTKARAEQVPEI